MEHMHLLVNGEVVNEISFTPAREVYESGWFLGDGVFETILVLNGKPIAISRHLDRLEKSAASLLMTLPERLSMEKWVAKVCQEFPYATGRLRLSVLSSGECVITYREHEMRDQSISLMKFPTPIHSQEFLRSLKSISYQMSTYALRLAKRAGYDDVVFINESDKVVESAIANIVFDIKGALVTPPLNSGALAGVTRQLLLENFTVIEDECDSSLLDTCDGIALVSSMKRIQLVSRYEARQLEQSKRLTELRGTFNEWIEKNTNP